MQAFHMKQNILLISLLLFAAVAYIPSSHGLPVDTAAGTSDCPQASR